MEENNTQTPSENTKDNKGSIIAITVVLVVVVGAIAAYMFTSRSDGAVTISETGGTNDSTSNSDLDEYEADDESMSGDDVIIVSGIYEDGTYTAVGSYNSPAGVEQVEVTLTLTDGTITESEVVSLGKHNTSKQMQARFIENYQGLVEGVHIDEVQLDTVGGSSLTPRGFEDALDAIKREASA